MRILPNTGHASVFPDTPSLRKGLKLLGGASPPRAGEKGFSHSGKTEAWIELGGPNLVYRLRRRHADDTPSLRNALKLLRTRINVTENRRSRGLVSFGRFKCTCGRFRISTHCKAQRGGYFEANKQFIAPLPIPDATDEEKKDVGARALRLQELHTRRRDLCAKIDQRLNSSRMVVKKRKETWLWADVGTVATWKKSDSAPKGLKGRELTAWAKGMMENKRLAHLNEWDARLRPGATIGVENTGDELTLNIDGHPVLKLFDESNTPFLAAQWRHMARSLAVTGKFTAKKLAGKLLTLHASDHPGIKKKVVNLDAEIIALDEKIREEEAAMNALVHRLYGLTEEEIRLVEKG